jgi:hypothetical protein
LPQIAGRPLFLLPVIVERKVYKVSSETVAKAYHGDVRRILNSSQSLRYLWTSERLVGMDEKREGNTLNCPSKYLLTRLIDLPT